MTCLWPGVNVWDRSSANTGAFPELNDAKIRKLRMLTIVQLAQENTVSCLLDMRALRNSELYLDLRDCYSLLGLVADDSVRAAARRTADRQRPSVGGFDY